MTHYSLHLLLPSLEPYTDEYYLESFVGEYVRPLADRLRLFWFSRYGSAGRREIKFRFSVDDFEVIRKEIEAIEKKFAHGSDGCGPYDYVGDWGADRFLAKDRRSIHKSQRALLVYEFLTASARLFIDCLSKHNEGWKHEEEKDSGYNRITPLETMHHLVCNMTGVPTWAAIIEKGTTHNVVSDIESRIICDQDHDFKLVGLIPIRH